MNLEEFYPSICRMASRIYGRGINSVSDPEDAAQAAFLYILSKPELTPRQWSTAAYLVIKKYKSQNSYVRYNGTRMSKLQRIPFSEVQSSLCYCVGEVDWNELPLTDLEKQCLHDYSQHDICRSKGRKPRGENLKSALDKMREYWKELR